MSNLIHTVEYPGPDSNYVYMNFLGLSSVNFYNDPAGGLHGFFLGMSNQRRKEEAFSKGQHGFVSSKSGYVYSQNPLPSVCLIFLGLPSLNRHFNPR